MAAVGSSIGGYYKSRERDALRHTPPPKTPAPPAEADTPLSAAEHKAALAGRVAPARVLAVSICPAPEDLAAGHVFSGEDGALLGKMFAAAGLAENEVRRTSWLHSVEFTPAAARLEAAAARMQAERELCGAQAVVLLGRFAREPPPCSPSPTPPASCACPNSKPKPGKNSNACATCCRPSENCVFRRLVPPINIGQTEHHPKRRVLSAWRKTIGKAV